MADELSDDAVAAILAKEAKDSSIKYSAIGMEAFLASSKPPANKPKPNTRFLRTIIKETSSHNAALLAKEAEESRARLHNLETKDARAAAVIRQRQLGSIAAHLSGISSSTKRKREEERERPGKDRSSRRDGDSRRGREDDTERDRKSRRRNTSSEDSDKETRRRRHSDDRDDRRKRHRDHDTRDREDRNHRHKSARHRSRSRSRSPCNRKSKSTSHRSRSPARRSRRSPTPPSQSTTSTKSKPVTISRAEDSGSDPLADVIGPLPPTRTQPRGRGRTSSSIDHHFSTTYDPTLDTAEPSPEEDDDWGLALEAVRDRMKWKEQGADRLRAAGFSEEEVKKWENSGKKGRGGSGDDGRLGAEDEGVRWTKKGEGREWDRGKVVGEGGIFGEMDAVADAVTAGHSNGILKDDHTIPEDIPPSPPAKKASKIEKPKPKRERRKVAGGGDLLASLLAGRGGKALGKRG